MNGSVSVQIPNLTVLDTSVFPLNYWEELFGIRGKDGWEFGGTGYRDREKKTLADPE